MSATIADAVLESLATLHSTPQSPPLPNDVQVWDGEVRGAPANRYFQALLGHELRGSSTVDDVARDFLFRFTIVSVAMNPDSSAPVTFLARNLARKGRDHLVGRRLSVDGFADVGPIRHVNTEGPYKDDDVSDRVVMFVSDDYEVLATS